MRGGLSDKRYFHFGAFSLLLAAGLYPNFSGGAFPLGGDGDFHLSYANVLRYFFSWSEDGLGTPNYAVEAVWPLPVILALLEPEIGIWGAKLLLNSLIYSLWFASAYLICMELKVPPFRSFLLSLFFVLNPFALSHLSRLNMALTAAPAAMMFFFWIILRNYGRGLKFFFLFGTASSLFAFANTNPPIMAVMQFSIIASVVIAHLCRGERPVEAVWNYLIVLSSFVLFNAWWLANLVSFVSSGADRAMYTGETASALLKVVMTGTDTILPRVLTLRTGFTVNPDENFFGFFYNSGPAVVFSAIPFAAACIYAAAARHKGSVPVIAALVLALGTAFFAKGTDAPFGSVYALLFEHAPFFNIFKGPIEKFGVLFLFSFTIFLALMGRTLGPGAGKAFDSVLALYAAFFCLPFLGGQLFPASAVPEIKGHTSGDEVDTFAYTDRPGFMEARAHVDAGEGEFRVLAMPGNRDYYAVTFVMRSNRVYSGVDPVFSNAKKPFIIYGASTADLYNGVREKGFERLLGIYNVGAISVNSAAIPRYGFAGGSPLELFSIFGGMDSRSFGDIAFFEPDKGFLPKIYASGL